MDRADPTGTSSCGSHIKDHNAIGCTSIGNISDSSSDSDKKNLEKAIAHESQETKTEQKNGWSFKRILVLKPTLAVSGIAALGSGLNVEKGLYNQNSPANVVIVAYGLATSVDTNILSISYQGSNKVQSPVMVGFGFSGEYHFGLGGRFSFAYTPPSTFKLSVDGGVGIGEGFHFYSLGKEFEK